MPKATQEFCSNAGTHTRTHVYTQQMRHPLSIRSVDGQCTVMQGDRTKRMYSKRSIHEIDALHDLKAGRLSYLSRSSDCATMTQGSCMGAALVAMADAI